MKRSETHSADANPRRARGYRRLLCSDLITVQWRNERGNLREEAAVLEDYSATGAGMYIATRIEPGVAITICTDWESFVGWVRRCVWRDNGYLLGIEFDEPRPEEALFTPDHMLDPEDLGL
jgi:hypothetical protein